MVAYESMLRIALHQPNGTHYQDFEESVKQRAFDHYNFSYGEEKVCSNGVGSFYDTTRIEFPLTMKQGKSHRIRSLGHQVHLSFETKPSSN